MQPVPPAPTAVSRRAEALRPLLLSLGREARERVDRLAQLLVALGRLPFEARPGREILEAECAEHRRALRLVHAELARLDCRLLGTNPLVFRIEGEGPQEKNALFWCPDD